MEIDVKMFERAIIFATEKHAGVTRKGNGLPYITHPLAVMTILLNIKKTNNPFLIGLAALFHDLVEDTDVTIQEIADNFGYKVAALVEELTSDKEKIASMGKKEYLLDKMLNMSSYGLRLKLGDRYHNISDMGSLDSINREKRILETNYILDGLSKRKLTKTHNILIKMIRKDISKFSKK